jgi:hypothetical protein
VTKSVAEDLLREKPGSTWNGITDRKQSQVLDDVNLHLREMDAPEVNLNVLGWRMPKVMWEIRNAKAKGSVLQSC